MDKGHSTSKHISNTILCRAQSGELEAEADWQGKTLECKACHKKFSWCFIIHPGVSLFMMGMFSN